MKPHRQLCGLALSLNLVGDHWTLLIVRELLPGPRRFSDLKAALAPVASNLLTSRLQEMTLKGLVEATTLAEAPVPAYTLTDRGRELQAVVGALIRWSVPEFLKHLGSGFTEDHRWLRVALPALVGESRWSGPELRVRIEAANEGFVLAFLPGEFPRVVTGGEAEVIVRGPYAALLGVFGGVLPPEPSARLAIEGGGPGWEALKALWSFPKARQG